MGPIQRNHSRRDVVERLIAHLREAKRMGCELVVFPELTLTTFFPRWWMTDQAEIDRLLRAQMPSNETAPLFNEAKRPAMGFRLGYAELANEDGKVRRFNTAILVERDGRIVGKYRKVHLPGHAEHEPERPFQHPEKRYFRGRQSRLPRCVKRVRRHHGDVHLQRPSLARDLSCDGPAECGDGCW